MVLDRSSWHYKVYDFSYAFSSRFTPQHTNLCTYVRRIFLVAPLVALGMACIFMAAVVGVILVYLFAPLFGLVPRQWAKPWTIYNDSGMYKYQGLSLGKRYNSPQLYPWHAILVLLLVAVEWAVVHSWGYHPLIIQGVIFGTIALMIALIFLSVRLSFAEEDDDSTLKLVKEYLSAKKQKVCPVVEFKNEE